MGKPANNLTIFPTSFFGKSYHWLNDTVKAVLAKCTFENGKCSECGQRPQVS